MTKRTNYIRRLISATLFAAGTTLVGPALAQGVATDNQTAQTQDQNSDQRSSGRGSFRQPPSLGIPFVDYGAGIPFVDYGAGIPFVDYGAGIPFVDYGAGVPVRGSHGYASRRPVGQGVPFINYSAGIPFIDYGAGAPVYHAPQYGRAIGHPAAYIIAIPVAVNYGGLAAAQTTSVRAAQPVVCMLKSAEGSDNSDVAMIAQSQQECGSVGGTVASKQTPDAPSN